MAKEKKQKMTLNVKRRSGEKSEQKEPPPVVDSAKVEAFASGAENASLNKAAPPAEQVVRDAFTMPAEDHKLFVEIKDKCLGMGLVVTKSEIVRAGLKYFAGLDDKKLEQIIKAVPKLKTGRPASGKK